MKTINKLLIIILIATGIVANQSCISNFLEQPLEAVINVDSVFANPDRAMQALWGVYGDANDPLLNGGLCETNGRGLGWAGNSMMWGYTDEGFYPRSQALPRYIINGTWGPDQNSFREFYIEGVYKALRTAMLFVENADKVPYKQTPTWNWDEAFKNQVKAEAKFWLAFWHFETAKRFGGIPLITKSTTYTQSPTGLVTDPSGARTSLRRTYDYILKLCDEVIPYLPDSYAASERGRVTKGVAYALKAKVLLFAASRWLNEAPVLSYGDTRDSLISFTTVDPNRWEKARVAALEAITWAEANGYQLLDEAGYTKTQSYLWGTTAGPSTSPLNKEVMLDRMHSASMQGSAGGGVYFYQGSATWRNYNRGPASPGVEIIRKYFRTKDGKDANFPITGGTFPELKTILKQMEPRFHAIVAAPGYFYAEYAHSSQNNLGGRDSLIFWYYKLAGAMTLAKTSNPTSYYGPYHGFFFMKKWFQFGTYTRMSFPLFRIAELYLNYAEAANEVNPNDPLILTYLNKIRTRGGIPNIEAVPETFAKVGDKDLMRFEVQRERAIELYGEEHRYFDVRRWKMADVNGGEWKTIELYENGTVANGNNYYENPTAGKTPAWRAANNSKLSYRFVLGADDASFSPRVWSEKMYFYPWQRSETNKGIIIQNPGW